MDIVERLKKTCPLLVMPDEHVKDLGMDPGPYDFPGMDQRILGQFWGYTYGLRIGFAVMQPTGDQRKHYHGAVLSGDKLPQMGARYVKAFVRYGKDGECVLGSARDVTGMHHCPVSGETRWIEVEGPCYSDISDEALTAVMAVLICELEAMVRRVQSDYGRKPQNPNGHDDLYRTPQMSGWERDWPR